jgi:hypothetical protein
LTTSRSWSRPEIDCATKAKRAAELVVVGQWDLKERPEWVSTGIDSMVKVVDRALGTPAPGLDDEIDETLRFDEREQTGVKPVEI